MTVTPDRVELAQLPTPLQPLDRLSDSMGGPRIWLKRDDLTEHTGSGNKLRKLEFSMAAAKAAGADVVITCGAAQSNHCRATAMAAAKMGLECHLILRTKPDPAPDGNLLLDQVLGARLTLVSNSEFQQLDRLFDSIEARYAAKGQSTYRIPLGASDELGMWGYINAAAELRQDFDKLGILPGYVVSAAGSGGTLAGLIVGKHLYELSAEIVAFNVCDDEAYFVNKITADLKTWQQRFECELPSLPINIIDGYVGPGYGRADPHVYQTIAQVARLEGVILDPVYTGKAFDAMLAELRSGRFADTSDIVFIHTGGLFGLFPLREAVNATVPLESMVESAPWNQ